MMGKKCEIKCEKKSEKKSEPLYILFSYFILFSEFSHHIKFNLKKSAVERALIFRF